MSSVIRLEGTYAARNATEAKTTEGLIAHGSTSDAAFYRKMSTELKGAHEIDVILVSGKKVLIHLSPGEEGGSEWMSRTRRYLSPTFYVKLEKPDTFLYSVAQTVPKYHAELGMINSFTGSMLVNIAMALTGFIGYALGFGWQSLIYALGAGVLMFAWWFIVRDYFWIALAALRSALFIRRRSYTLPHDRTHYRHIVQHLAECEDNGVARIHRLTLYLI